MPFVKGQKKIEGSGRKKGSLNKRTRLVEEILEDRGLNIADRLANLIDHSKDLSDRDKAYILLQMMPYVYPKLTTVKVEKTPEEEELENLSTEELRAEVLKTIVLEEGAGYVKGKLKELEASKKSKVSKES